MKSSEAWERAHKGGPWLSTMRSFIQSRVIGGDTVTWGSNSEARGLTIADLEEVSMMIAAATMQEVLK